LIEGEVSRVAQFGAFVSLEPGIEALLHTSQMADPAPEDPTGLLHEGQKLLMRIISIESHRQRLGLSLKDVTQDERDRWTEEHGTILAVILPGAGVVSTSEVDSELPAEVEDQVEDYIGQPIDEHVEELTQEPAEEQVSE
jgi:ribosomal protein S1